MMTHDAKHRITDSIESLRYFLDTADGIREERLNKYLSALNDALNIAYFDCDSKAWTLFSGIAQNAREYAERFQNDGIGCDDVFGELPADASTSATDLRMECERKYGNELLSNADVMLATLEKLVADECDLLSADPVSAE